MIEEYKCGNCGKTNCKLWRDVSLNLHLLCCDCAAKKEGKSVADIDERGFRQSDVVPDSRTNQIGYYVPAIPTEDGGGFYGYTDVPPASSAWWDGLPTRSTT